MKVNTVLITCGLIVLMLTACMSTGVSDVTGTPGGDGAEEIAQARNAQPAADEGTEAKDEPQSEARTDADAGSSEAALVKAIPRMDPFHSGSGIVVQILPHPVRQYEAAGPGGTIAEDGSEAASGGVTAAADGHIEAIAPVETDRTMETPEQAAAGDDPGGRTALAGQGRQPDAAESTPRTAAASGSKAGSSGAGNSSAGSSRAQTSGAHSAGSQTAGAQIAGARPSRAEEQPETYDDTILAAVGETVQISLPDHRWVFDRLNSDTGGGLEFEDIQYLQSSKDFIFHAESVGEARLVFTRQDLDTGSTGKTVIRVSIREMSDKLAALQEKDEEEIPPEKDLPAMEFSGEILQQELRERNIPGVERQLELLNALLNSEQTRDVSGHVSETAAETRETADEKIDWNPVIDAAGRLSGSRYESTAVESLLFYLRLDASSRERIAEVYYLLGAMYESPPYPRDEREAVKYYRKVTEIYPTNTYYFRAEERIKYLERHFLQIR